MIKDTTFEFTSPCGHTYEVPAIKCTMETGPGCNCGKPWLYHIEDIQCPTCQYKPGFLERPIWTHIGLGMGNLQGILSLDLYKDDPDGEEGFEGPLPTVRLL